MDILLFNELYGKVVFDVEEMWQTFGSAINDQSLLRAAQKLNLYDPNVPKWLGWPAVASEANVLAWFLNFMGKIQTIYDYPSPYQFVTSGSLPLKDGDCIRKADIVLTTRPANTGPSEKSQTSISWHSVRLIGELKSNFDKANRDLTFLQLANYAREIFGAQPNRRWIHGFTLTGCFLRVWRFDHGGACGSDLINIHNLPALFLRTMIFYLYMDATAIGFDPTIRWSPHGTEVVFDPTIYYVTPHPPLPFIYVPVYSTTTVTRDVALSESHDPHNPPASTSASPSMVLSLNPSPVSRHFPIATRGSVCWQARLRDAPPDSPWLYVVKDQWRAEDRETEGSLLRDAQNNGVSYPGCGLPRYLWHGDIVHDSKGASGLEDIHFIRRQFSPPAAQPTDVTPMCLQRVGKESKHLYKASLCLLENRVHTRLVTGPVGRPLIQYTSYTELLCAIRDAVEGHRHMYRHKILHRDISVNNILLHGDLGPNHPGGFLIDFDLAIRMDPRANSEAMHRTGTFDFMALEVLIAPEGHQHNPLHDLESFFYVFIWVLMKYPRNREPNSEDLQKVFHRPAASDKNPFLTAAVFKQYYMGRRCFAKHVIRVMEEEIQRLLSPTIRRWWNVTFPPDEEEQVLGPEELEAEQARSIEERYNQVLEILIHGIASLAGA